MDVRGVFQFDLLRGESGGQQSVQRLLGRPGTGSAGGPANTGHARHRSVPLLPGSIISSSWSSSDAPLSSTFCRKQLELLVSLTFTFTFRFGAFRRFYPKRLTISTFVRRWRNNISVDTVRMFIDPSAEH